MFLQGGWVVVWQTLYNITLIRQCMLGAGCYSILSVLQLPYNANNNKTHDMRVSRILCWGCCCASAVRSSNRVAAVVLVLFDSDKQTAMGFTCYAYVQEELHTYADGTVVAAGKQNRLEQRREINVDRLGQESFHIVFRTGRYRDATDRSNRLIVGNSHLLVTN